MKSIIIGTAGHIDHGKTALVKALTGIDADRFEEEKRRGITIDLGFAHLELTALSREQIVYGPAFVQASAAFRDRKASETC
jgi:selenocysteine-specific elongation factor